MKCSSNEIHLRTEMFQSFPAYKKDDILIDCGLTVQV